MSHPARQAFTESDLRRAISDERIAPWFQPISRLQTRSIDSFEVLARWRDPLRGDIAPNHFIPVAERAGHISALTDVMIGKGCAVAMEWSGDFSLAFNISPVQFRDESLISRIRDAAGDFPLHRLQIEITESAVIQNVAIARRMINRLKDLGIAIVLDDFGTGYSSLTRLQALPFDKIKIDASFVASMSVSRDSRKIVGAVVGLGQSLGMPVVAEGVETEAQCAMLIRLGCDFGQGRLLGKPVEAEFVPLLLRTRGRKANEPAPVDLSCNQRLAHLQAIYDDAPVALCFLNRDLCFVSANRRYGEMTGVDINAAIGRPIADVFPEAYKFAFADLASVIAGQVVPPVEYPTKSGGWCLVTVVAARDEDDEVVGISVSMIDLAVHGNEIGRGSDHQSSSGRYPRRLA